ncbi:MAG: hypothetical protein RL030_1178 [Pseudomonadota bacterium]
MFALAQWLGTTPLSQAIQSRTWLIALLQGLHILMIGLVFVSMLMVALRVLGRVRNDETIDEVWSRFAPWLWGGLSVMIGTGVLLIIGEPERQAHALSFWIKMALVVIAVWGARMLRKRPTKDLAWFMILIWILIIFLGRAIAYDVEVWGTWHLGT